MRVKRWLTLLFVMAMAAGLVIIPATAEEGLLAGTGDLADSTVTFSVTADRETVVYAGQEETVTFTVDVANDSANALNAFSFFLEPDDGLTLASKRKEDGANEDFCYAYPGDADLLNYYETFEYSPARRYFGAAQKEGTGTGIVSGGKTVLTIMGKVSATGDYTLTLNTTDKDKVVVAGQVSGSGSETVSAYFNRKVNPATVRVVAGGVISGTVTDGASAVGGAVVTLRDSEGAQVGEAVTADGDGGFTFPAVANGSYTLDITAQAGGKTLRGGGSATVDKYAVDAGSVTVREFQKGDVNKNGKVDILDVERLFEHVQGKNPLDAAGLSLADVNANGKVDILDVERLFEHVQGKNPLV